MQEALLVMEITVYGRYTRRSVFYGRDVNMEVKGIGNEIINSNAYEKNVRRKLIVSFRVQYE
jgi:hypothetical protein